VTSPEVGRTYETEDGLVYYVLSITSNRGIMKMKYLVINVDSVEAKELAHLLDVGEIGEFIGSFNLEWSDKLLW
jgi:hypothetical protein